jgi:DNA-binding NarL/FixJ family response regulator
VIRVLLADDQALFREGLATVLGAKGVDVVGEAKNGLEAVELAARLAPDVVLMDLRMPELDGVEATRRIAALSKPPRIIVLTTFDDDASVFEALRAGAVGYLLKDVGSARLVEAIEAAARGESSLAPQVATKLVGAIQKLSSSPPPRDAARELGLSEREVAVLRGLARGLANKDIASELRIAEGTVKNHVTNILDKLEVEDRTQAALRARDLGIV